MTRLNLCLLALFSFSIVSAQKVPEFGILTQEEQNFAKYDKDSLANAIVLYEKGDNYFKVIHHRIRLIKEYHGKIKILDKGGFSEGTISIPLYKGEKESERVEKIRAITHNGNHRASLMPDKIYTNQISERWSEKTFTFPNVKVGAVLEYRYTVISPFIYHLNGWDFQSNIPKLYSEYNAKIPGNYLYNRSLTGSLRLAVNEARTEKGCFKVEGYSQAADCEVLKYSMTDIPAFKEESYMLAPSNYYSRIAFELSEYHRLDGTTHRYTKTWADVDQEFRSDRDIGRQLTKKGFFEKNVPEELLQGGNNLQSARKIYRFIQQHYAWNGNYGIYGDIRVKEAFEEQKGNIGEINISLINLLNVAGIPTQLMMTSTRDHGLPRRTHPVLSDFNYIIAKATINGKAYYLDASDKYNPFGMLPYRCLNYYGRVMDFKNDSYWEDIIVPDKSKYMVRAQVTFDVENRVVKGIFDETNLGYEAVHRRKLIGDQTTDTYLKTIENRTAGNFTITNYELLEERTTDKMVTERIEFEQDNPFVNDKIYFNPFVVRFFDQDPFLAEQRQHPIDFGYSRNYLYNINILLPEGYKMDQLPEDKELVLPDDMGLLKFTMELAGGNINLYYNLLLNRPHFKPEHYAQVKELFREALKVQNKSLIVIRKSQMDSNSGK